MDSQERQAALELARQGDTQALGELLQSFRPYIRTVVHGFRGEQLRPRVDDSDMIQDALVEAHRSFAGFQGTTMAEFAAWLRRIAVRSAGRTSRKLAGTRGAGPGDVGGSAVEGILDSGSTPSAQASRHELVARITDALAGLPRDMQQVLLGRLVDGLPHAVIAERLGRTEAAVRVLYVRALAELRNRCQDLASGSRPPAV